MLICFQGLKYFIPYFSGFVCAVTFSHAPSSAMQKSLLCIFNILSVMCCGKLLLWSYLLELYMVLMSAVCNLNLDSLEEQHWSLILLKNETLNSFQTFQHSLILDSIVGELACCVWVIADGYIIDCELPLAGFALWLKWTCYQFWLFSQFLLDALFALSLSGGLTA